MTRVVRTTIGALLAAAAACTGVTAVPRASGPGVGTGPHGTGRVGERATGRTGPDSAFFGRGREPRARAAYDGDTRRVCRTGAWPRGWVAVAYERGGGGCPGREAGDSAGVAAVLVRAAGQPLDTRLDICADQPIPTGWSEVRDESVGDPTACPGAERGGRAAVRRVRRVS